MIGFGIPGGYEWIIVLVIVLLLFGHRLPGMARSLGSGITEFKRGLKDGSKEGGSAKVSTISKDEAGGGDDKPSTTDDPSPPNPPEA